MVSHPYWVGKLWHDDYGQDIAEYAIILAVLLVLAIGVVKLIGTNSTAVFTAVAAKVIS
jgi:Flp pilus assembly pilin Flp